PIDRNVFGLLDEFGDAELVMMVLPRHLDLEQCKTPQVDLPGQGGAPAHIVNQDERAFLDEMERTTQLAETFTQKLGQSDLMSYIGVHVPRNEGKGHYLNTTVLDNFLQHLANARVPNSDSQSKLLDGSRNAEARQEKQQREIDRHNQWL